MLDRRRFLKNVGAATGTIVVGRGLMDAPPQPQQSREAPPRRQVMLAGRRAKTVDFHAHCATAEGMAMAGTAPNTPGLFMAPERLRLMDGQGIDVQALS